MTPWKIHSRLDRFIVRYMTVSIPNLTIAVFRSTAFGNEQYRYALGNYVIQLDKFL